METLVIADYPSILYNQESRGVEVRVAIPIPQAQCVQTGKGTSGEYLMQPRRETRLAMSQVSRQGKAMSAELVGGN